MSAGGQREGRTVQELERRRQALIAELTSDFGTMGFNTLDETAVSVESFLLHAIKRLVCAESEALFRANKIDTDNRFFVCGFREYRVEATPALFSGDELLVAVMPHELGTALPKQDTLSHRVKIDGHGRYQRVTAYVPRGLKTDRDLLERVIKLTVETVYAWINRQILKLVASESKAIAAELYSYVRTIFLREDVWRRLWFGAMCEGRGFRLFDEFVAAAAFDDARKHSGGFGRGANDTVAEILKTNLPIEQLLMRNVIARRDPIEVDISKASYQQSTYSEAMRALYGSTSFVIYPILTDVEWPDKVIALYPTALRSEVDSVLNAHRSALREIAKKSQTRIRETLRAMRMHPSVLGHLEREIASVGGHLRLVADDRIVVWNGKSYPASPTQFEVIRVLNDLAKDGHRLVHQKNVLKAVTTKSNRLRDLFKGHDLFRTLIKPHGRGYFSLEIDPSQQK